MWLPSTLVLLHLAQLAKAARILHLPLTPAIPLSESGDGSGSGVPHWKRGLPATAPLSADPDLVIYGYRGWVEVGTPPQRFTVQLDTGSNRFWVRGDGCTACREPKFRANRSTTHAGAGDPFTQELMDGSQILGRAGTDVVQFAGVRLERVDVVSMERTTLDYSTIDGIMGLGFTPPGQPPTFWDVLVQRSLVPAPLFSYHLSPPAPGEEGGALLLGGVDRARMGTPLQWVPVEPGPGGVNQRWQLALANLTVRRSTPGTGIQPTFPFPRSGGLGSLVPQLLVHVDTGTSLVAMSHGNVEQLHALLGVPLVRTGRWYIPCSATNGTLPDGMPEVTFHFAQEITLILRPQDYILVLGAPGKRECMSVFYGVASLDDQTMVLGNAFLRPFYTVFDAGRRAIGFAPLRAGGNGGSGSGLVAQQLLEPLLESERAPVAASNPDSIVFLHNGGGQQRALWSLGLGGLVVLLLVPARLWAGA